MLLGVSVLTCLESLFKFCLPLFFFFFLWEEEIAVVIIELFLSVYNRCEYCQITCGVYLIELFIE